jgi:PAS domain S-box-containing protein
MYYATESKDIEKELPFEFVFQNSTGDRYHGLVNINSIFNFESEKIGLILTITDISRLKIEKEKFKELDQFEKSFDENENIWLSLCDLSSNIIMWNKGAERISGYTKEEVFGDNEIWQWLKPDETAGGFSTTKGATRIDDTIISEDFESIIKRKDGKERVLSWNSNIFVDQNNNPKGTIAIGRDITHRRENEEKIKRQNDELLRVNEVLEEKVKERTEKIQDLLDQKNEFINQLGHDLKTPLTPLMVLLPLIKAEIQTEAKQEMVDVLIRNTLYMKDMITKTIELAKLNSDMISLDFQQVCLYDEVETVKNDDMVILKENNILLKNNIATDLMVKADSLRLREIFTNLITNAIKYSHDNGGQIEIEAEVAADLVTISVRDDGIGMTDDQKSKIFDEFYKVDESRHNLSSSGLGLTITKRLVEQHGGSIWVESDGLGKGSTFYFTLKKSDENLSQ